MKDNISKFGVVVFALFLSIITFADNGSKLTQEQRVAKRVQKMNEVCNLSLEQQQQLTEVFTLAIEENKAKRKEVKAVKKSENKEIRKSASVAAPYTQLKTKVQSVLTEEQQAKWQAFLKERRKK